MNYEYEDISVIPISEKYIDSLYRCIVSVANERKYLGYVEPPSLESTRENVIEDIQSNTPRYIATTGDTVVGWCEVLPNTRQGFRHCGRLESMGVSAVYRGNGIGKNLMAATLSAAERYGLERVELLVYASNVNAILFYERLGFVCEGTKKRARKLDGVYDDVNIMAIFLNPVSPIV